MSNSRALKKQRSSGRRSGPTTAKPAVDHTKEILKLQFQSIGEEYDNEFIKQPNWYMMKRSTDAQRADFLRMFKEYVIKHKLADRKSAAIEYAYWDLQYGWSHAS